VIWKAKFKGKECYIFIIFEFLSKDDDKLVLRVLNYLIQFYLKLVKNERYQLPLPPVFPVVIYTGEKYFNGKLNIKDIIEIGDKSLDKYIPDFKFFLLEISRLPKQAILRMMIHSKNLTSLIFNVEKIDEERISEEIVQIVKIIKEYANAELIKDFQDFLFNIIPDENTEIKKIIESIDQEGDMFYEKVKKWELNKKLEGKLEGRLEGRLEVAKNLLKDKVDIRLISKATELSLSKIRSLQKEIE
jgi:predicted transposase/invertase (TIGR01784 family)